MQSMAAGAGPLSDRDQSPTNPSGNGNGSSVVVVFIMTNYVSIYKKNQERTYEIFTISYSPVVVYARRVYLPQCG